MSVNLSPDQIAKEKEHQNAIKIGLRGGEKGEAPTTIVEKDEFVSGFDPSKQDLAATHYDYLAWAGKLPTKPVNENQ